MGVNFKFDEGRVYGSRYYTVQPLPDDDTYYNIPWYDMMEWVEQSLGPSKDSIWFSNEKAPTPNERWYANNSKFWFRNKKDLEWFILRWQ